MSSEARINCMLFVYIVTIKLSYMILTFLSNNLSFSVTSFPLFPFALFSSTPHSIFLNYNSFFSLLSPFSYLFYPSLFSSLLLLLFLPTSFSAPDTSSFHRTCTSFFLLPHPSFHSPTPISVLYPTLPHFIPSCFLVYTALLSDITASRFSFLTQLSFPFFSTPHFPSPLRLPSP